MHEEDTPQLPALASLEKLERRYPELANLLDLRPSANRSRFRRTALETSQTTNTARTNSESLSHEEKQVMGKWLQSHYDRLSQKLKKIDPNFPV